MLPAGARLRRRADFVTALRRGRRARAADLVLVHAAAPSGTPQQRSEPARVGFAVPRAVGPAVVRNRVRRRLRHVVAAQLAELPAGALLVVRALPGSATATSAALAAAVRDASARALNRPAPAATVRGAR